MNEPKPFGELLRNLRRSKHITQREMADAAGLSFADIARIENGRQAATLEILTRVAPYLGIEADLLIRASRG